MSVLERSEDQEAEWHAWRAGGVTATEIADALNATYGGAYAVVARKLGLLEREETNEQMARGHRWQPVIADAVHVLTGHWVVGEETWAQHPAHPRHRATVDGFLAPTAEASPDDLTAVVEVKTRGSGTRPNRERWHTQTQWQMWVTGLDRAVIAEATIDDDCDECRGVRLMWVEADRDYQALLVSVAGDLLAHIDAGTLPDPDTPSALPVVKALTGTADAEAEPVDLSELVEDVARFADIKAAVKAVTDERDALEARIRAAVGSALVGVCDGWEVKVSKPAMTLSAEAEAELLAARPDLGRLVLDREKAKAEAPDLYESARRPIGARRLTTKEQKR